MAFVNDIKTIYGNYMKDEFDKTEYEAQLNEYSGLRQKFINGKFEFNDYVNAGGASATNVYLPFILERPKQDCFGSIRGGVSRKFNIYKNKKNEIHIVDSKFPLQSQLQNPKSTIATQAEATSYFNGFIVEVLKMMWNNNFSSSNLYDPSKDENNLFEEYNGKNVLMKMKALDVRILTTAKPMLGTFKDDNIIAIAKLLNINPTSDLFDLSNKCQEEIIKQCGLNRLDFINTLNDVSKEQKDYCLYKATWEAFCINNENSIVEQADNLIIKKINQCFIKNKQIIISGSPGTGKTYSAILYAQAISKKFGYSNNIEFVQFHPSYDYSDFVEGLKPALIGSNTTASFVKIEGIFKSFCRKIVRETYKKQYKNYPKINNFNEFKSEYNNISEEKMDKYYFVIDEINRADLGKVFGELMYGLEESYRGIDNAFDTQLEYLPTYEIMSGKATKILKEDDVFNNGFFIPKNLYIIATMNDIDKNVESIDFALRRRFKCIHVNANEVMYNGLKTMYSSSVSRQDIKNISDRVINMNNILIEEGSKFGLNEDYQIGHAYFKEKFINWSDLLGSLNEIFDNNISSIIREYLRGRDSKKISAIIEKCSRSFR